MRTGLTEQAGTSRRPLPHRSWYVVGISLILLSFPLHVPLLVIAGLLMGALALIPEIWYRFSLTGVVVDQRISAERALLGDTLTLTLRIENQKLLPLPGLEVESELPAQLPVQGTSLFPALKPDRIVLINALALWLAQRVTRRYRLECRNRGVFTIGPLVLRSGDPFGLVKRERRVDTTTTVVVYPLVVPLDRLRLPARFPSGERTSTARLFDDPYQPAGTRPYVPGDEPRHIHWKATARAGETQSKIFEPTTHHTLTICLNVSTLDAIGATFDPALFELGVCVAASVATWATKRGYAVGLIANGSLVSERPRQARLVDRVRLPPSSAPLYLKHIMETLARLTPFRTASMEAVLVAERKHLPRGTSLVYITAATTLVSADIAMLVRLRAQGYAVQVLVTGESEQLRADTHTLPVHMIGGKEVWNALEAAALAHTDIGSGFTLDARSPAR